MSREGVRKLPELSTLSNCIVRIYEDGIVIAPRNKATKLQVLDNDFLTQPAGEQMKVENGEIGIKHRKAIFGRDG